MPGGAQHSVPFINGGLLIWSILGATGLQQLRKIETLAVMHARVQNNGFVQCQYLYFTYGYFYRERCELLKFIDDIFIFCIGLIPN